MCGFYLQFSNNYPLKNININTLKKELKRRGPDYFGFKFELDKKLLLSHSRLAIQDLSNAASQPMQLDNSNITLLFNGEIYNNQFLRKRFLKTTDFITNSDSETLIRLIDKFGIEKSLNLIDGMISLAIFSKNDNSIYFYRDKSSQKPLFYSFSSDFQSFAISSNPSLIFRLSPNFSKEYDESQLLNYIRNGFTEVEKTMYERLFSSAPGKIGKIRLSDLKIDLNFGKVYINNKDCFDQSQIELFQQTTASINSSLIGARSCGILLSGGVDSTVTAIASSKLNKISRAYTLFCPGEDESELKQAREISLKLNLELFPIELKPEHGLEVIQNLAEIIDYPNPDPAIISSYATAKEASKYDTILLTGDGGDEIFGGYNRYHVYLKRFGLVYQYLPLNIKFKILNLYMRNFSTKFSKKKMNYQNFFKSLIKKNNPLLFDLCQIDRNLYMAQHTLPKTDRALMYFSLEGRAPLLNNFFQNHSKLFIENNSRNIKKRFLRNYIDSNLGKGVYYFDSKRGFSPYLNRLSVNREFLALLIENILQLKNLFADKDNQLNNTYYRKLISNNESYSKVDLRNMWHLFSFVACDKYY